MFDSCYTHKSTHTQTRIFPDIFDAVTLTPMHRHCAHPLQQASVGNYVTHMCTCDSDDSCVSFCQPIGARFHLHMHAHAWYNQVATVLLSTDVQRAKEATC